MRSTYIEFLTIEIQYLPNFGQRCCVGQDLLLRVKAPPAFAWGVCQLVPILILLFFGANFFDPNFSNLQDLGVIALPNFVDLTRAFGGVCEADLKKIFSAAKIQSSATDRSNMETICIQET